MAQHSRQRSMGAISKSRETIQEIHNIHIPKRSCQSSCSSVLSSQPSQGRQKTVLNLNARFSILATLFLFIVSRRCSWTGLNWFWSNSYPARSNLGWLKKIENCFFDIDSFLETHGMTFSRWYSEFYLTEISICQYRIYDLNQQFLDLYDGFLPLLYGKFIVVLSTIE